MRASIVYTTVHTVVAGCLAGVRQRANLVNKSSLSYGEKEELARWTVTVSRGRCEVNSVHIHAVML